VKFATGKLHSWSRNCPLASPLLHHCCITPIVTLSSLFYPRTLPNHCGRLKRSQYHPQSHIFPIRRPSLPSCTLPEGVQHILLQRLNTRTAKEDHHSLLLSFGVGCWLFWPLPSLRCTPLLISKCPGFVCTYLPWWVLNIIFLLHFLMSNTNYCTAMWLRHPKEESHMAQLLNVMLENYLNYLKFAAGRFCDHFLWLVLLWLIDHHVNFQGCHSADLHPTHC